MALAVVDTKDGISYTGETLTTPIVFTLLGGKYIVFGTAAGTTNVLSVLAPDGSTYIAVDSETTSAFYKMYDLIPGTYQIVVTTSSAVSGGVQKVPYNTSHW